jgi:hypothetical protein
MGGREQLGLPETQENPSSVPIEASPKDGDSQDRHAGSTAEIRGANRKDGPRPVNLVQGKIGQIC